ncbi:response regulator transcription factor [Enterococcus aquimarinus]|nr:helix-turn-helix domain-containing protein [Enterococcus aquimarinus]
MYKVFIVEDEPRIRDTLRNHILMISNQLSITYCGEAGDGEMALASIIDLKPDIILTDIKMPFMDGVAFSKEARKILPNVRIIYISGFDEFEYAKAGIQVQIDDYLLKPIKPHDLKESLEKIVSMLDKQKEVLEEQTPKMDIILDLKRNHLLNGLFKGELALADALKKTEEIGCSFIGKKIAVLLARSKYKHNFDDYTQFGKELNIFFQNDSRLLYSSSSSRFIKFLILSDTKKEVLSTAYQVSQILIHEFKNEETGSMTVSIGSVVDRMSEIPLSFEIAKTQLTSSPFSQHQKVISYEDRQNTKDKLIGPPIDIDIQKELVELTIENQTELVNKLLTIQETPEQTVMYRFFILVELKNIAQKKEEFPEEVIQNLSDLRHLVLLANDYQLYQETLERFIHYFIQLKISPSINRHNKLIDHAIQFIDKNFTNPDISLNMVAEEVALSPSHFSTIFSQSMGKTFIDYLTEQRINHAKRLLTETNLRLTEITMRIGYNDPNYFSFLFKKKQGMSPSEYRQKTN